MMVHFLINNIGLNADKKIYELIKNDNTHSLFITNPNMVTKTKMDINALGISFYIKVFDLKTLIKKIYRDYIHELEIINSETQRILFLKAIIKASPNLKVLGGYYEEIVDDIIDIYNTEKRLVLKKTNYRNLKIDDINLIIETYLELIKDKYIDEVNIYKVVNKYLKENEIYRDYNIYINDLYYFDELEKDIILSLLKGSKNSYMVFFTDKEINGLEIIYENYQYFLNNLDNINFINIDNENPYKEFLINHLFSFNDVKYDDNVPISLYGASDPYDEVVFVANKIENLRRLYNYHYRDFLIVANNPNDYERYMDLIFKDNYIPYHKKRMINPNFTQFINLLLDIIDGDIKNKTIIKLLKFEYFNLSFELIEKLNQYIYVNNLENNDFNFNHEIDDVIISFVNDVIINKLSNLKEINNTKDFLITFYHYLEENILINRINIDAWNQMMHTLDLINAYLGEEKLNIKLLKRIINYYTNRVVTEKDYVNEVLFGNSDTLFGQKAKVVFFIGMNEDIVPKINKDNLLLNSYLKELYYSNYPSLNDILINQFKTLYFLNCGSEHTYLSYSKVGNDGNLINPSLIIKKIHNLFPKLNIIEKSHLDEFINLENLVFNQYALFNENSYRHALNEYFKSNNKYQLIFDKINYLHHFYDVEPLTNLSNYLYLSATRIDTYVKCPFQYFCQYLLNLKPIERQKYDQKLVGTYIHYLLERLINEKSDDIDQILNDSKQIFIKEHLLNINATTNYFLKRLNDNIKLIWPIIKKELDNNKFIPTYFEIDIANTDKWHPLIIQDNELTIKLSGIIDRIDIYDKYYRIIDYKTGDKKINLNEIVVGLNLQLFIYLLFAYNNLKDKMGAGIFYMLVYYSFNNGKDYRLNGMFLNNDDVIDALGGNNINEYIDAYSYNRLKDNVLYSEEQLLKLIAFTKRKIIEIGKRINSGDIKIDPIKNSKVCEYCHYKAICGVEKNTKIGHYLEKYELVDIWKIIGGEVND